MPQCRERCKNQLGKPPGLLVIEQKQGARGAGGFSTSNPLPDQNQKEKNKKSGCQQDSVSPCVTNAQVSSSPTRPCTDKASAHTHTPMPGTSQCLAVGPVPCALPCPGSQPAEILLLPGRTKQLRAAVAGRGRRQKHGAAGEPSRPPDLYISLSAPRHGHPRAHPVLGLQHPPHAPPGAAPSPSPLDPEEGSPQLPLPSSRRAQNAAGSTATEQRQPSPTANKQLTKQPPSLHAFPMQMSSGRDKIISGRVILQRKEPDGHLFRGI